MKDNPRPHRGHVTFQNPGERLTLQVWSYSFGRGREYHIAFIDDKDHTVCQGKFLVPKSRPR